MSKRKINQQQQRRIANKHVKILNTPELQGLVIAHHGQNLEIEDANQKIIMCKKRQHLGAIVPGDKVVWQLDPESNIGVVLAIEPRSTLLSRPDARGELHAVAANVQQMFVVIAPTPAPQHTTVDRYLIAAQLQNIQPILILNKEDLLPTDPQQEQLLKFVEQYIQLDVETIIVSAKEKQHLSLLYDKLQDKISVFVGQSGVGKSSLLATILPEHEIRTGDLSVLGSHGKHTTTTARLYHLNDFKGDIIDSPGIREFPLWTMNAAQLATNFTEFLPFLSECKFRNCIHVNEAGCALINAAAEGKISATRLLSYQKILSGMPNKSN